VVAGINQRFFLFFSLILFLSSCGSLVKNFDERLSKKYVRQGFSAQSIDKNGHHIYYWDNKKENAPVLIFVHGFGGNGKISWMEQASEFQEDYRVIIPDILWFGESTSSQKPTLTSQIHALKTLVQELGLENIHLCGISYGGFMVLGYATKFSKDLRSLCIVDSPGNVITDEEIDDFCESIGVKNIKEAFVLQNSDDVKRLLNFSFYKPPSLPPFIRKQTIGIYFSKHPEKQRGLLDNLPKNRDSISGKTAVPTLILWGKEDAVFKEANAYDLQKEIGAELTVFEKAGHALPEEQHKKFNERYRSFLEKN
jgi:pimeloyl-ACP methyl ester carboxylesterase